METYFNQNLKLMRETCGFSQAELADKLGLKRAVISTYERDANVPKFETLIKLRMLFEVSIDDMIFSRMGVELEFKPIRKLRAGKDVRTGESNCTIFDVSHRRELLLAFVEYYNNYCKGADELYISEVESFLEESQ